MASAADAEANGIIIVHQDQQLVAQFDVTRNVFRGIERTSGGGLLNLPEMRAETEKALAKIGANFAADTLVRDLSGPARTGGDRRRSHAQSENLHPRRTHRLAFRGRSGFPRHRHSRIADQGITIVCISHYLDEVLDLVDRMTSRQDIIKIMVGREISQLYPKEEVEIGPSPSRA